MKHYLFILLVVFIVPLTLSAQSDDKITLLKRDGQQNEVPLLNNRFRIDYKVEEINLLFFRKPGTPAVVLVQPDGSKLYATSAIKEPNVDWFDEISYDLITIREPTPGPWQVVGSILPDSRIVVIGDIDLKVEPLPPLLLEERQLK